MREIWIAGILKEWVANGSVPGPIVRINPEELHCDDPAFADQVYGTSGKRRDKFAYFLNAFGPQ